MPVWVGRVRLERVGIGQASVGAVNGDAHTLFWVSKSKVKDGENGPLCGSLLV
jgi:hypothetical protein